ncbi:MAG TPA: hypothetical protein VLL25_18065 [Acidimicrobiales bacterium]|nr:hypothetical protein [Acidimicrobiales bacterium]
MAKCRSCRARIVWAVTENGKRIPLDEQTTSEGNLERTGQLDDGTPIVRFLALHEAIPTHPDRYVSHFASCPDSGKWRRR